MSKKEIDGKNLESSEIDFITHQLKSPIDAIQTLLDTISQGYTGEVNQQTRYVVKRAIERASEAKGIISDLLDYSIYTEDHDTNRKELDLSKLLSSLAVKYAAVASEKGISLHSSLPTRERIFIFGDDSGLFSPGF